ncbi:MAG TPA: sigma-70 family RNA polymerase sigma factor [Sphingomicrobium sp.]|nr:sigma-70 family RNA polymerase sigma factor [Sphingomicrobium sp.]
MLTSSPGTEQEPVACASSDGEMQRQVQELYRRHSPALVRRLARKTGCVELARDLANEAFLKVLGLAPAKFRLIEQPQAFLWRVSVNLLHDWGRARSLSERSKPMLESGDQKLLDQVAVLESRDTLRRLEQAIERLRPRTREIFLAHRIRGLTYAEIANETGLTVKGVEKQMSKAIAKIDRLFDRG